MVQFMLKAVREAKVHTSWTGQNEGYEEAVRNFTRAALDPALAGEFLREFVSTCQPIFIAGALNSLALTAIKIVAPGIPDIYQGTELWDLSLVDPDNRRPVDFKSRRSQLEAIAAIRVDDLVGTWRDGAIKMRLLQAGLKLRNATKDIFEKGDYLGLEIEGHAAEHALAIARLLGNDAIVVVAPRLCLKLLEGHDKPLVPPFRWGDTAVRLPPRLAQRQLRDVVTERRISGESLPLTEVLQNFPVGMLTT
jgi:(1->4)-alpha-D-glucan 1-alpha-D-glucosylmutase